MDYIRLIMTDVLGTLVSFAGVDPDETRAYGAHLKAFRETGVWKPLKLPDSWKHLHAFADCYEGLDRLRVKYRVVTCSNAPLGFTTELLKYAGLQVDAITPLEMIQCYKTDPRCYLFASRVHGVEPAETMMLTANRTFGDLEAAERLGMLPQLIDRAGDQLGKPKTLLELAQRLGC